MEVTQKALLEKAIRNVINPSDYHFIVGPYCFSGCREYYCSRVTAEYVRLLSIKRGKRKAK